MHGADTAILFFPAGSISYKVLNKLHSLLPVKGFTRTVHVCKKKSDSKNRAIFQVFHHCCENRRTHLNAVHANIETECFSGGFRKYANFLMGVLLNYRFRLIILLRALFCSSKIPRIATC